MKSFIKLTKFCFLTLLVFLYTNATNYYNPIMESQYLLSDVALFHRCYAHITGLRAPPTHPFLNAIQAGALDPVDACMSIFDKAMVSQSTNKINNVDDLEALNVMRVFFDFHKSWFSFNDFLYAPITYGDNLEFHYEPSQEACFLTHALFSGTGLNADGTYKNTYSYKNVVTSNKDIQCLRTEPTRYGVNRYDSATYSTLPSWAEAPGRGFLIGTKERAEFDNTWYSRTGRPITTISYFAGGGGENLDTNILHTLGGGLLGGSSMLIKYGQYANNSDGAAFLRRRVTNNMMESMLCRSAPFRRIEDVSLEVIEFNTKYPTDSTLPFRRDTACMSCHSTQDGLAGVFRNVQYIASQGNVDWNDNGVWGRPPDETNFNRFADGADKTYLVRAHKISSTPETLAPHLVLKDDTFHNRPPNGRLVYRSYDGSEVNHLIAVSGAGPYGAGEGIRKAGELMASGNDLYVCAAKRYFEFFTGINANLYDPGDSRNVALTPADQKYKNVVVQLGMNLKTHQSLRNLVKEIISSEIYQKESMRGLQ